MAINSLTISQDNKLNGSDLLSVHNPLAFICNAFYSGQNPSFIYVDLYVETILIKTLKAIPFKDLTGTLRQFVFIASDILRSQMDMPEDFGQSANTLMFVDNLTKEMSLTFRDPDGIAAPVSTSFVICAGASQFGDANGANLLEQFNNDSQIYYCGKGGRAYVYFYNADTNNILSIGGPLETNYAVDSTLDIFTDSNNDRFLIL